MEQAEPAPLRSNLAARFFAPHALDGGRRGTQRSLAVLALLGAGVPMVSWWISTAFHPNWLWDTSRSVGYAPLAIWVGLVCLLGLSMLGLDRIEGRMRHATWAGYSLAILWVTSALVAFVRFPVRAALHWGDAPHWVTVAPELTLYTSEPIGCLMHHLAFLVLFHVRGLLDSVAAIRASSIAAGAFAMAVALTVTRRALPRNDVLASVLLLLVTPTFRLYAGYVESTPWAYAFATLYLLLGLRYLNGTARRAPWPESLALALTVASHGMACFVTAAQLVLLHAYLGRQRDGVELRHVFATFGCAALPFTLLAGGFVYAYAHPELTHGAVWYTNATGGGDASVFVAAPWARSVDWSGWSHYYVALEPLHLHALANLVLAACPWLLMAGFFAATTRARLPMQTRFLGLALAGLLLFDLSWNADWGMEHDFDLFALFALPATLFGLLYVGERFSVRQQRLLAWLVVPAVLAYSIAPLLEPGL